MKMPWSKSEPERKEAKEALERQIAQEKEELENAPKIAIQSGLMERCHVCGQVFSSNQLRSYDSHITPRLVRRACPNCHPERGSL